MAVYQISPASVGREFTAAWFDNDECLWADDRLRRPGSLAAEWQPPKLRLFRPERGPTQVLFNPHACAVAPALREALSAFSELEFLPIEIEGHGHFFVLHRLVGLSLPEGSVVRRPNPPANGNVVQIDSFPAGFEPETAFFRIMQPADSPAGRLGRTVIADYANERGAKALLEVAGQYFKAEEVACA